MQRFRILATVAVFLVMIFGLGLLHILLPDAALSTAERRKLQQAPAFSMEGVFDGSYMTDLESYLLDQFPARDTFRRIKAVTRFDLLRQRDNNGVYLVGDSVFKLEYPLDQGAVQYAADLLNKIQAEHMQGMNVYYAIVPDKNYFAAAANGYPAIDYDALNAQVYDTLTGMTYIDLYGTLTLEDYYRTDTHWRQECLQETVSALCAGMGLGEYAPDLSQWTAHTLSPFYGVYYGQSALDIEPDTLTYLTSPATDAAVLTGTEFAGELPVYTADRFAGMDGYDVYMNGAQALLTLECPDAATDKELILFRDSFGSSIAPLLSGVYAKITLVDIRYFNSAFLGEYIDFADQDVLFLYSASLFNNGRLLR